LAAVAEWDQRLPALSTHPILGPSGKLVFGGRVDHGSGLGNLGKQKYQYYVKFLMEKMIREKMNKNSL
jgi:hypothetical protein